MKSLIGLLTSLEFEVGSLSLLVCETRHYKRGVDQAGNLKTLCTEIL